MYVREGRVHIYVREDTKKSKRVYINYERVHIYRQAQGGHLFALWVVVPVKIVVQVGAVPPVIITECHRELVGERGVVIHKRSGY